MRTRNELLAAAFLRRHPLVATETRNWGDGMEMHLSAYLTPDSPPAELVTSVRALVLRGDQVLLMRNEDGPHLLPGGRVEDGQGELDALCRELVEEAGVELREVTRLGCVHLRHRAPRPPDYGYPHPHSFHLVFASRYVAAREPRTSDDYETSAEFVPVEGLAERTSLGPVDLAFLYAARARWSE